MKGEAPDKAADALDPAKNLQKDEDIPDDNDGRWKMGQIPDGARKHEVFVVDEQAEERRRKGDVEHILSEKRALLRRPEKVDYDVTEKENEDAEIKDIRKNTGIEKRELAAFDKQRDDTQHQGQENETIDLLAFYGDVSSNTLAQHGGTPDICSESRVDAQTSSIKSAFPILDSRRLLVRLPS